MSDYTKVVCMSVYVPLYIEIHTVLNAMSWPRAIMHLWYVEEKHYHLRAYTHTHIEQHVRTYVLGLSISCACTRTQSLHTCIPISKNIYHSKKVSIARTVRSEVETMSVSGSTLSQLLLASA